MNLSRQLAFLLLLGNLLYPVGAWSQTGWTLQSTAPTARAQAAIAADTSGHIFVLGGWDNSTVFNTVDIYDTTNNTWTTGPAMPVAMRGASAVYYNNNLYVIGGYASSQLNQIQILDLSTNIWTQATLPSGGWETSAAVVGNQIIIVGGESNSLQTFSFDPANNTTATLANNINGSLASQLAVVNGKLYLIGATSTYSPSGTSLDVYTPGTDTWSTIPADDPTARTQFAAATDGSKIYVAGGSTTAINNTSPFYTSTAIYDPVSDTWSAGADLPVGLRESAGLFLNGNFYVFGGNTSSGASAALYAFQAIPEPSTFALLATGLTGLILLARRRHA